MPRGKGLGGSSAINFEMYIRGDKQDYDDWEKLGNKGWGFKDFFLYFKKHQTFDDPKLHTAKSNILLETEFDPQHHGTDGPIHTSFSTWRLPLEKEWIEASSKNGDNIASPPDAWSGDHIGTFHSLSSINRTPGPFNGTRSYSTTGYLLPNASRPNLRVLTEALVSKIILVDGAATGVSFIHSSKEYSIHSKKEVILSAGSVKSPQILELSGIGNPSILSAAGVPCLIPNLRIGENFQDHPVTVLGYQLIPGEKSLDELKDPAALQVAIAEYTTSKSGPLANSSAAMSFISYASISSPSEIEALQKLIMEDSTPGYDKAARELIAKSIADLSYASIQYVLIPASATLGSSSPRPPPPENMKGKHGVVLAICVARPLSIGSVHITTSDANASPAIDPNYACHPADVEILQKGLEHAIKIFNTSPLKEKIAGLYHPDPKEKVVDWERKEEREEWVRDSVTTEWHLCGSVPMGVEGVGAVDERLRLRGVRGLRVVDASVMPMHVSGNIQSTVYAIAEKGADLVKEDWGI